MFVQSKHSKDPELMHLVRCLRLTEYSCDFTLESKHLPGKLHLVANALSHGKLNIPLFHPHYPQDLTDPTTNPTRHAPAHSGTKPHWTFQYSIPVFHSTFPFQTAAVHVLSKTWIHEYTVHGFITAHCRNLATRL